MTIGDFFSMLMLIELLIVGLALLSEQMSEK